MGKIWDKVGENNEKVLKVLNRVVLPSDKGRQDIQAFANLVGVDEDINIMTKVDIFEFAIFVYMLGREEGKKLERQKAKTKELLSNGIKQKAN